VTPPSPTPRRIRIGARDGLALSAAEWGAWNDRTPILCLPGVSRTALDFTGLALRHAGERRVVALDYAGHGESARAADAGRYGSEAAVRDVLDAMAALHLHRVALVGTSFGGLVAMAMAALRPAALAAVALNDIGPEIEPGGRAWVIDFIGQDPACLTLDDAAEHLRRTLPPLSIRDEAGWRRMAELTYAKGEDERWHPRWDTRIAEVARQGPVSDMWPLFGGLAHVPLFLAWGQESDILSASTVQRMRRMRPDMTVVSLPGIGHNPSLNEPEVAEALDPFLRAVT
jgi:pimeloyl-ACP methyl ester carboxylesterase